MDMLFFVKQHTGIIYTIVAIYLLCTFALCFGKSGKNGHISTWTYLLSGLFFGGLSFFMFFDVAPQFAHYVTRREAIPEEVIINMAIFIGCGYFAKYNMNMFNRGSIISYSKEITNSVLKNLPDEYEVYNDVYIGDVKIDHVVVGNNGVFVVVDRSVRGVIHCDSNDSRWVVDKTGRNGGEYTSSLANPIKQANWQARMVSDYLQDNNCQIWVDGCVFFSNDDATLLHAPDKCFTSQRSLASYITDYQPRKNVNPQKIALAKKCLKMA